MDFKGASGMIKFLAGSCLSGLGIVLKEPYGDLILWMKPPVKAETFINSPGRFFHYEPLFTSFIRLWRDLSAKNLIIPEAVMFSKIKVLLNHQFSIFNVAFVT